jgi:dTMP kinase
MEIIQMSPKQCYEIVPPNVNLGTLTGKLFVIEGADGSGRSTQISLLTDWLEHDGYAVVNVGLKRSTLISNELNSAQQSKAISPITLRLFYATDFMDQLENVIIPALRAGFIVLADRYIYTLMARAIVRGADPAWVESLYSLALIPDAVFYLMVRPRILIERNFQKKSTLDYWESGMDIGYSQDVFKSFFTYQRQIQSQFLKMKDKYDFQLINGSRSVRAIIKDLKERIAELLQGWVSNG